MQLANIVNLTLSSLTVIGQVVALTILILLILDGRGNAKAGKALAFIGKNAIMLGFVVALISMLGSLTYSDVLGFAPCKLCWYQRICMYPEVFLLGLALIRKEKAILPYAFLLAVIGEVIALYHYVIQLGVLPAPCTVSGYSVSCAKVFVLQFGYITIPLMAFTAFILIMLLMILGKRTQAVR